MPDIPDKKTTTVDEAAEAKSNFLAMMSHEMRTPLQSVYGLLELIALEKPSPNILEMVNIARSSATDLLDLLDDILDFAKIDADKMELDVFEVPVRTLARGVIEALSVKAQGKPIELKDQIEIDVPFVIVGDPKRLRQILINFVGNALKFTEKGSVKIRITRKCQNLPAAKEGKLNLRFEVIDTGIGVTEETKKKLFKTFTQADSSTARKYGGTGLGLSICKKLVELMDGRIGVYSVHGQGSTFWFEIPTEEVSVTDTGHDMPDLSGLSVLSVEDHPQAAKEILNSLRSMGAKVENCGTAAEALQLVKQIPFDVAIVDQGLPDGLGIDLIRNLMELRPFMGMFMYTVRDDAGLQQSLHTLGIKYLSKPASRLGLGQSVLEAAQQNKFTQISGPTRLLIAEDTPSVQDLLKRQLKMLNVEADFVMNGKEALEALKTGKYGILFTDLHMPEMDGYEVVKTIRSTEKDKQQLPVIVLTADVQMAQRQVYMSHGFNECLLKPVTLGHFRRLLMRWGLLKEEDFKEQSPAPQTIQKTDVNAPIDLNAMQEQMGAFDDSAKEMLGFFIEMTKPVLMRLQKGADKNDLHEIKEAAHSLKGAARSACANILGDIAAQIQDEAEKGILPGNKANEISQEFARVEEEIRKLISN